MRDGGRSDFLDVELTQTAPVPLDVKLSCGAGELLALVGPSGSGKSTVLRSIAGLTPVTAGRVRVGEDVWLDTRTGLNIPPQRRRVGLVFQEYALFPHLSALDNVALAAEGRRRAERREAAAALLKRLNLEGFEARRPGQLSGGQKQRVAIARALAREPRVLLLDEPFSAVDQMTRERLKRELAVLRAGLDMPIILVTHDISEALALADRVSVLYRGKTVGSGTPADVRLRPPSAVVARLMGETNIFLGVVETSSAEGRVGSLRWGERRLDVRDTGLAREGDHVAWLAPSDHIVLHRRGRAASGDEENPVAGIVREVVPLGDRFAVAISVDGEASSLLNFKVSSHTWRRNELAPGTQVTVSLLADAIHVLGSEPSAGPI